MAGLQAFFKKMHLSCGCFTELDQINRHYKNRNSLNLKSSLDADHFEQSMIGLSKRIFEYFSKIRQDFKT